MLILGIALFAALLALLPHLVFLLSRLAGRMARFRVRYRPFGITALALVGVWALLVLWGNVYGRFRSEVKEVQLPLETLPAAFDGLRIVHISDLHLDGWAGHEKELQQRVHQINALEPDIICFTGDLISLSTDELKPFIPILRQLKGVYSVLGNHDYMPYSPFARESEREARLAELIRMEREELGWTLLLNESAVICRGTDSLAILLDDVNIGNRQLEAIIIISVIDRVTGPLCAGYVFAQDAFIHKILNITVCRVSRALVEVRPIL